MPKMKDLSVNALAMGPCAQHTNCAQGTHCAGGTQCPEGTCAPGSHCPATGCVAASGCVAATTGIADKGWEFSGEAVEQLHAQLRQRIAEAPI